MTTEPKPDPSENRDPEDAAAEEAADNSLHTDTSEASFWDESQIHEVIRYAGERGRSPEEFFTKKWKEKLIHKKSKDEAASSDESS